MSNYLTTEGLRQVLNAIKEKFSKNGHKHTVGDISDLKLVAKTGKYSDLSGLPTIPSVAVAKQNKVGLVMPGKGIVVSGTGALSINVDFFVESSDPTFPTISVTREHASREFMYVYENKELF